MTLDEFLLKYNGEYVEVAGSANAKNQCVDLANLYLREVLGLPIIEWTNAIDFPKKSSLEFVRNTSEGVPEPGDLIIFSIGDYGHIAIFVEGDAKSFRSFDQNYPIGTPCHIQNHYYKTVIGWLRCKIEPDMTDEEKRILQFVRDQNANEGKVREAFGALQDQPDKNRQIQTLQERTLTLENSLKALEDRIVALESEIKANQDLVTDWQKQVASANRRVDELNQIVEDITDEKNQFKRWYEQSLTKRIDKMRVVEIIAYLFRRFIKSQ
jgi:archaellum component FlaC